MQKRGPRPLAGDRQQAAGLRSKATQEQIKLHQPAPVDVDHLYAAVHAPVTQRSPNAEAPEAEEKHMMDWVEQEYLGLLLDNGPAAGEHRMG